MSQIPPRPNDGHDSEIPTKAQLQVKRLPFAIHEINDSSGILNRVVWVLIVFAAAWPNAVWAETNHELWVYISAQTELDTNWTGAVGVGARHSDALGGLSDRFVEAQAARKLSPSWEIVPSFRFNKARTNSGLKRSELQPGLSAVWKGTVDKWNLRTRMRVEYRDFDLPGDTWRFRFQLRFDPPMLEGSRWKPYMSNETFHDSGDNFIDENRLFVGTHWTYDKNWSADLFLGWRHRPNATALANSIIGGVGLRAKF